MIKTTRLGLSAAVAAVIGGACTDSQPVATHSPPAFVGASAAYSPPESVLTPLGWRPVSQSHLIPRGHSLSLQSGHVQERDAAGNVVHDLGAYQYGPADTLVFPPGEALHHDGGGSIAGLGSGWITYAYWYRTPGDAISSDTTRWVVPPVPSSWDGQTIFLFNGARNNIWLLQPVLQFGPSAAGGGSYWAVACWNASSNVATYTTAVQVSVGDTVVGVVDSGGPGSGVAYVCSAHAPGADVGLGLYGQWPELWQAVEMLEAHNLVTCSDYPNTDSTAFFGIGIRTHTGYPSLSWTAVDTIRDCGQHTNVVSNTNPGGTVDVFYRNPPPPPPPPLYVSISGPSVITQKGTYTWTANPSGGTPPYQYQWTLQYDGGPRYQEGTLQTQSLTVSAGAPNFWMIVAVTGGGSAADSIYVRNCIGQSAPLMPPGGGGCVPNAPLITPASGH